MSKVQLLLCAVCASFAVLIVSCETAGPPSSARSRGAETYAASQAERPGLGTAWGETRSSRVVETGFHRANPNKPVAVAAIYYNDPAGILAMASGVSPRRTWPVLSGPAAALVSVGLRDQSGRFLPGLIVGGRWFVVGEARRRYSIVVRNWSELRLEVVLSVDGLDVIDGRAAAFNKRGYIIPRHGSVTVQGFRQSLNEVAAFRFSSVRESYANQKYGDTRNVGVVGIAVFNEYGTNPWTSEEVRRRLKANPFPGGTFATPP
jgi:hypothetical protein